MLFDLFEKRKGLQNSCMSLYTYIYEEYYVYGKINIFLQLGVYGETCDKRFNISKFYMHICIYFL